MLSRLQKRCALTVALLGLFALTAGPAAAADPSPPPWLKVENGQTQPQFDFAQAIEEVVFVETDSTATGTASATACAFGSAAPPRRKSGLQGPGRVRAQPVSGRLRRRRQPQRRLRRAPQENLFGSAARARSARAARSKRTRAASARARSRARLKARANLPGSSLDDYYVPRGYAVVLGEHRHVQLRRLPDGRRPRRDARDQGCDRLAERPRAASTRSATRSRRTGRPAPSA